MASFNQSIASSMTQHSSSHKCELEFTHLTLEIFANWCLIIGNYSLGLTQGIYATISRGNNEEHPRF
jgi:hypothetical protein